MPETTQSDLVEKLRALDAAATGGTWIAAPFSSIVGAPIVSSPSGRSVASVTYFDLGDGFRKHDEESAANAELVTFLRNAVPDILGMAAEITRLRAHCKAIADAADGVSRLRGSHSSRAVLRRRVAAYRKENPDA